jgi:nucleotide-binding universal stress UspA family protein
MTTIVVPLDGSPFAERALRPAVSIAARLADARVLLLGCAPDDIDAAQRHLDDRAGLYSEVATVRTRLVVGGDPAEVILATAETERDGILCMATHGRGGLLSTVLGSVAKQVVCRSTRPLLLAGPRCRTALLPAERGRMLICSDGSAFSGSIASTATSWCDRLELEPWFTEVVGPDENPEPSHHPVPNREVEAARKRLDELIAASPTSTETARTEVLHGEPGRSIASFAEQLPAALVAMATHGRSGFTRLTMGSVATEVVRHAPCPVLLTRPTDDRSCLDD